MQEDDRIRIQHMLDAADEATVFAANRGRKDLEEDRMLTLALIRSIEIIGEAGARVSEAGRREIPEIPWHDSISMRNRLIHAYFDVDLDVVWATVRNDLPPLTIALRRALEDQG